MMSPTRGRVKSSAQGEVQSPAHDECQSVPPHGTASREELKQEQVLDQKPAKAQDEPDNLMDMETDKLDLESNIRKGVPVHTDNQLPHQQE